MGDIVDFMNQSGLHDMPDPFDHDDYAEGYGVKEPLRCKYCYSQQVSWMKPDGKWRLYDRITKTPHTCKEYATSNRC